MRLIKTGLILMALVLTGCASQIQVQQADSWPGRENIEASAAITALVQQASTQRQEGLYREAIYTLERALRIAPNEPLIYQQMAWTRFEQQRLQEAEQLARRGISLSRSPAQREQFEILLDKINRDDT
ncbi:tetratricopeptide repeat protein [Spongorhabdus nitratireducens]